MVTWDLLINNRKEMKLSCILSTVAYAATTGRQRRDTTCPTDWTLHAGQTTCSPSGSDFSVTCGQDSVTINFSGNHIYEDSKDWIVSTDPGLDQTSQVFATFETSTGGSCANSGVMLTHHTGSGTFSYVVDWALQSGCGYETSHVGGDIKFTGYLTGSQGIASAVDGDGDDVHLGTAFRFPVTCTFTDLVEDVQFTANTKRGTFESGHDLQVEGEPTATVDIIEFALTATQTGTTVDAANPAQIGQPLEFTLSGTNVPVGVNFFIDSCTAYPDTANDPVSYDIVQVS